MTTLGLALLALAPSGQSHFVDFEGPNGLDSIQAAIDVAANGDTIYVMEPVTTGFRPVRDGFHLDGKGLTIVGIEPRTNVDHVLVRPSEIVNVPGGATVTIRNLEFSHDHGPGHEHGLSVSHSTGAVRLEHCRTTELIDSLAPTAALDLHFAIDVSVVDCTIHGNGSGAIRASRSRVTVYRSEIIGGCGDGETSYTQAIAGNGHTSVVVESRSFIWLGLTLVEGGRGGSADCFHNAPCDAVSGDGGDGMHVEPGSLAVVHQSSIEGGDPGFSGGYTPGSGIGVPGVPVVGSTLDVPGPHRELTAEATVQSGELVDVTVKGIPGETATLIAGSAGGHRYFGAPSGVLLVNGGFVGAPIDLGVIPASGEVQAQISLPDEVDEGSSTYTLQASCRDAQGQFRMTQPRQVTVLGDNAPLLETPSRVFVDSNAAPGGRGRSWDHPARNLNDLFASLPRRGADSVELWLTRGRYTPAPSADPLAKGPLQITRSISIVGGFLGHETNESERQTGSFSTLSGDLLADDREPGGTRLDNSNGLLEIDPSFATSECRLVGLRFSGSDGAPGVMISAVTTEIDGCEFVGNRASSSAAGLLLFNQGLPDHHAVIRSSRFVDNRGGFGGAIQTSWSHQPMQELRLEVSNCEFISNRGHQWIYDHGLGMRVTVGGAILHGDDSVARIVNSSFLDNESALEGGSDLVGWAGLHSQYGVFELYNCALSNSLSEGGAAPIRSTLDPAAGHVIEHTACAWAVPGWSTTNLPLRPGFVDMLGPDGVRGTGDEDVRIGPESPCVDAANEGALSASILLDVAGLPRYVDQPLVAGPSILDIGAHEVQ
ncbi:MAG: hypothetical protein AAF726_16475 [Planctomycetota bacterium]